MKLHKAYLIEYSEHQFLEILKKFWDLQKNRYLSDQV